MGRCTCPPMVKLNPGVDVRTKLLWFPVTKKGHSAGEVLMAAELLLKDKVKKALQTGNILQHRFMIHTLKLMLRSALQVTEGDLPLVPARRGDKLYMVPQGIRPVVQLTAIEVPHKAMQLLRQEL